jgi:transcriptional regulator of acetoin/glycerol metabolism
VQRARQRIVALLEEHQGKVSYVTRDMGKTRTPIHRWMQRFRIDPGDYRVDAARRGATCNMLL